MQYLLVVFAAFVGICHATSIPVSVYYESLCPDSIKFITKQLYPALTSELKGSFNVTLVPYGKSTTETTPTDFNFTCHHGNVECYGNMVQACILDIVKNEDQRLKYINCLMSSVNLTTVDYPTEPCAKSAAVDLATNNITGCANGTRGRYLLKELGEKTNKFQMPLKSVPTVVVNETYTEDRQKLAVNNFSGLVCSLLTDKIKPKVCTTAGSAVVTVSAAVLLLHVVLHFF